MTREIFQNCEFWFLSMNENHFFVQLLKKTHVLHTSEVMISKVPRALPRTIQPKAPELMPLSNTVIWLCRHTNTGYFCRLKQQTHRKAVIPNVWSETGRRSD